MPNTLVAEVYREPHFCHDLVTKGFGKMLEEITVVLETTGHFNRICPYLRLRHGADV